MTIATASRAGALALACFLTPLMVVAEEPNAPAKFLEGLGLTPQKSRYVLADDEDALRRKYREALDAVDDAREALGKVEDGAMMEQGIAGLQADEQALRSEIAAMRSGAGRMTRGRRRGGGSVRNQANAAIRQDEAALNQVRAQLKAATKQKPSAKQKQAAEAGARQAGERAREVARQVVTAYEGLLQSYEDVRAKPGLVQALEDAGRPKKIVFGLGPSEDCEKIGKWAASTARVHIKKPSAPAKAAEIKPTAAAPAGGESRRGGPGS